MDRYNFPHDPNRYPTDCTEIHFPTSPRHQAFDNLASQVEAYTFNTLKPAHMSYPQGQTNWKGVYQKSNYKYHSCCALWVRGWRGHGGSVDRPHGSVAGGLCASAERCVLDPGCVLTRSKVPGLESWVYGFAVQNGLEFGSSEFQLVFKAWGPHRPCCRFSRKDVHRDSAQNLNYTAILDPALFQGLPVKNMDVDGMKHLLPSAPTKMDWRTGTSYKGTIQLLHFPPGWSFVSCETLH